MHLHEPPARSRQQAAWWRCHDAIAGLRIDQHANEDSRRRSPWQCSQRAVLAITSRQTAPPPLGGELDSAHGTRVSIGVVTVSTSEMIAVMVIAHQAGNTTTQVPKDADQYGEAGAIPGIVSPKDTCHSVALIANSHALLQPKKVMRNTAAMKSWAQPAINIGANPEQSTRRGKSAMFFTVPGDRSPYGRDDEDPGKIGSILLRRRQW